LLDIWSVWSATVSPPRRFRPVYRAFDGIDFDPRESDEILADRGFDLAYIARMFPGRVLEREETRFYRENRYQEIGDMLGTAYFVVYTRLGRRCRLITARVGEHEDRVPGYGRT
jgi:uncharacterized DUF497 family protein